MGLIRKTLAVSTLGAVRPSSKKQRVAAKTERNTRVAAEQLRQLNALAVAQQQKEERFRYDTDHVYRAWVDEQERQELERLEAGLRAREAAKVARREVRAKAWRELGRAWALPVQYLVVVPVAVVLVGCWALPVGLFNRSAMHRAFALLRPVLHRWF